MTAILTRAICFVLLIFLAYALKKKKIFPQDAFKTVSAIVVKITLPCAIVTNFCSTEFDASLFFLAPLGFIGTLTLVAMGYLSARKESPDEKAFQMINHSGYNIGTFALPYLESFVGPTGVIYACMFDIGNSVLCTGGTYALASSVQNPDNKITIGSLLKKTLSSIPTMTYLLMTILGLLHLSLPQAVQTFFQIPASANGFLAMTMLGLGMELSLNVEHWKKIGRILTTRYACSAVFALVVWFLLPFSYEIRRTLVVLLFAPLASFDPIFTSYCDGDVGLSSEIVSISILTSLFFMTALFVTL